MVTGILLGQNKELRERNKDEDAMKEWSTKKLKGGEKWFSVKPYFAINMLLTRHLLLMMTTNMVSQAWMDKRIKKKT